MKFKKSFMSLFMFMLLFVFIGCGSDNGGGEFVAPSSTPTSQKSTITGYVVDDPIQNATIELQEINGTLIKRFESITNVDGSFSIEVDEEYKNKDFILRAYNGTILNKSFDGDLYAYHLSGDDLKINLTPLNTLLLILSSEFSDVEFSNRLSKAKTLLSSTYSISDDEFTFIKDSKFSNFNIVKFRELVGSVGFNSLVHSLVADSIDGYADESDSKLLFSSAKQRILKNAGANFSVVDTALESDDISELSIRGVSEKEDGTTGTMDMLTDVIATKTNTLQDSDGNDVIEETIVFRSFNVGKWKGKLNEETTLLARIFMDYRLMNLTPSVQESIATKLLKERVDDFKNAIKYQDMATDMPFAYPYYIELMEGLRVFALSYISNYTITQTDKIDATLSKFSNFLKQEKPYTSDEKKLVSMGLLQVRATTESLEFANYAKVNYGFRAYEIDGVAQAYDYPFFDFEANIIKSVVKGGTAGGLYDFMRTNWIFPKFQDNGNKIEYEKELLGDNNSFDNISKVKLEMYKWQWGYPTLLNVADGIELAVKVGTSGKSLSEKIKTNFDGVSSFLDKLKKGLSAVDTGVTIANTIIDGLEPFNLISEEAKTFKEDANKKYNRIKKSYTYLNGLLENKGYDTKNIRKWDDIAKSVGLKSLFVPHNGNNNFSMNFTKLLEGNINNNNILMLGGFTALLLKPAKNKALAKDKLTDLKKSIASFNRTYKDYFTFEQMNYVMAYIALGKDKYSEKSLSDKLGINKRILKQGIKIYKSTITKYLGKSFQKIDIIAMVKSYLTDLSSLAQDAEIFGKMLSGTEDISKGDFRKVFTAVANFMITFVEGTSKDKIVDVAKSAVKAIFGGGTTVVFKANDISSYVAGNFLTPNKQYLELNKDGDKISIKRPPLTLVGMDSNRLNKGTGFYNIFNKKAINSSYLIAVDNEDNFTYIPFFDVYLSQVRESNFKNMLKNATFPGNTFMLFDLKVEKSNNNKIDGDFTLYQNKSNVQELKINDLKNVSIRKGKNDLYSFNIVEAWIKKIGDYKAISIKGNERGVYRDFMRAKFVQPIATEKEFILPEELSLKVSTKKNYVYKASTGKALGKNVVIEKVERDGKEWLRIANNNSFGIYFEVKYDNIVRAISDNRVTVGDTYIGAKEVYMLPLYKNFLDNKGKHNDVEFIFYDEIAEDFFTNIGFSGVRLDNYLDIYNRFGKLYKEVEKLTYTIELDDIGKKDYLTIVNLESTLSDKGEVKVEFNMLLSHESINKIKVYDNEEKRYLNSDEYTIVHTSGNKYLITINNYQNNHEYKLVFPSTLVSKNGTKFLDEREISDFIYYNQAPTAKVKADKNSIKEGEIVTLDASESFDIDGNIVSYEWVKSDDYEWTDEYDTPLGIGKILPIDSLSMGTNNIILKVTDNNGKTDTAKIVIEVGNPLTKPINLKQEKISDTKTKITWNSVPNAEGYMVYTSEDGWYDKLIGEEGAGNKEYNITNPSFTSILLDTEKDKEYWISVRAYKGNRYSPFSEIFKIIIEEDTILYQTIKGTVKDDSGLALSDINVKFEYLVDGEEKSTIAITDATGTYTIKVDEKFINKDASYLIYAYKEGFVPSTKTLKIADSSNIDFIINRIKENEVVLEIEPKVHHLGDGDFSGNINSQFQKNTEGTEFIKEFEISLTQYNNYSKATLKFDAKGIQNYGNKLTINEKLYTLSSSPSDGSYKTYSIELEKSTYHEGSNTLKITSGLASGSDYDDFEFSNIVLEFESINSQKKERLTRLLGADNAGGEAIISDSEGNIYVAGAISDLSFDGQNAYGYMDVLVTKFDKNGNRLWSKRIGGDQNDLTYSIGITSTNNIFVVGATSSKIFDGHDKQLQDASYDAFVIVLDSNGNKLWSDLMGGIKSDVAYNATSDKNGNIYITGYSSSDYEGITNNGSSDVFITKFSSNGTKVWTQLLGGVSVEWGNDLDIDDNGNIYIVGTTYTSSFNSQTRNDNYDLFLLKLNSSGSMQWIKTLGEEGSEVAQSIKITENNEVFIVGFTSSEKFDGHTVPRSGNYSYKGNFLLQYDTNGNKVNSLLLENTSYNNGYVILGEDNYIYLTFYSAVNFVEGYSTMGLNDIYVVKYDLNGKKIWSEQFGGSGNDFVGGTSNGASHTNGISVSSEGVIYLTGTNQDLSGNTKFEGIENEAESGNDMFMVRLK